MKVVSINTVCNGSTGKIMGSISSSLIESGEEAFCIYGRRKGYANIPCKKIGGFFSFWYHVFLTTVFDLHGHGSYFKTKKVVHELKKLKPDIIQLHNIHGYYINYKILFDYLKNEYQGRVFWTLHDCLPFTGHCAYFSNVFCEKWESGCHNCPNKKCYPVSLFLDNSKNNYIFKKRVFSGVKNLTIITPSVWLKNIISRSFLKEYKTVAINNGIDLNIFYPRLADSIFDKYNIPKDKKVLLGVASIWEKRKGLDDFLMLSKLVNDDYVIVLVGLNNKQISKLKQYKNIIGIRRTENQDDLASLYSVSFVLINPTYEDNYPTVNIEALACGTRVIAYDTGGCVEQAINPNMYIVKKTTKDNNVKNIIELLETMDDHQDFDTSIYSDKLFTKKMLDEYRK